MVTCHYTHGIRDPEMSYLCKKFKYTGMVAGEADSHDRSEHQQQLRGIVRTPTSRQLAELKLWIHPLGYLKTNRYMMIIIKPLRYSKTRVSSCDLFVFTENSGSLMREQSGWLQRSEFPKVCRILIMNEGGIPEEVINLRELVREKRICLPSQTTRAPRLP